MIWWLYILQIELMICAINNSNEFHINTNICKAIYKFIFIVKHWFLDHRSGEKQSHYAGHKSRNQLTKSRAGQLERLTIKRQRSTRQLKKQMQCRVGNIYRPCCNNEHWDVFECRICNNKKRHDIFLVYICIKYKIKMYWNWTW